MEGLVGGARQVVMVMVVVVMVMVVVVVVVVITVLYFSILRVEDEVDK